MSSRKPTFRDLIEESTLTDARLAELSGLGESTIRLLKHKGHASNKTKWKLVHTLNSVLKRNYTLDDIEH